jgi:hypothetical protein
LLLLPAASSAPACDVFLEPWPESVPVLLLLLLYTQLLRECLDLQGTIKTAAHQHTATLTNMLQQPQLAMCMCKGNTDNNSCELSPAAAASRIQVPTTVTQT